MARQYLVLTRLLGLIALRDRLGLFFSFLVPVIITALFGLFSFGGPPDVDVGIVDEAGTPASARFIQGLREVEALKITTGSRDAELQALRRGQRDLVLVFPAGFDPSPRASASIRMYAHAGRPQEVSIGEAILRQVIDEATFAALSAQPIARLEREEVEGSRLSYVDFLIPGMVAMAIMQLGLFSVAFGIVRLRRTGVLRRLMATPLRPASWLAAFATVRLVLVIGQVLVIVGMGVLLFGFRLAGSFVELLAIAALGGAVFLALGFAVAGRAGSEDQAAPLTNLVSMPQMFLSGIFFPREVLPAWLRPVTEFFPLTFLAEGSRQIATYGDHLWQVPGALLGLAAWLVASFVLAALVFRFE